MQRESVDATTDLCKSSPTELSYFAQHKTKHNHINSTESKINDDDNVLTLGSKAMAHVPDTIQTTLVTLISVLPNLN